MPRHRLQPIGNRYTGTASSPSLGVTPTGTSVPARPQNAPLVPPLVLPGTEGSRDAEGLSPRIRVAPLTYDDVRRGGEWQGQASGTPSGVVGVGCHLDGLSLCTPADAVARRVRHSPVSSLFAAERLVLPSQSPRPGAHASVATSQAGDIAARTSGGLSLPPTPQPGTALGPRESSATAGGLSESLTRRTLQCTAQMLEMELQHERALETRACLRGSSEGGADVAPGGLSIELRGATEGTAGERVREGWGEERAAMRAAQETSDASSVTVARYAQPFVEEAERAEGGAGAGGGESMPLGTGPRGPAWHKRDQSMGAESMKSMESADAGVRQSLDESVRVSQGEKALTADRAGPRDWEEGGFRGEEGEEEGRWRFWPFASSGGVGRRAGRERPEASGSGRESEGTAEGGRFVKTMTPTSEDLAAMGLKPGQNEVVFVCQRTEMRAYLYVYDWDAKLVVSDIDGTITRSDLMGHVMTAVGRDWTHRGIAELFRGVVRNGYEMMYLSSRSISQAASTRDFLHNLKQPGEAAGRDGLHSMPLGPVILSPDGLFRSVTREIILRRPHEFKVGVPSFARLAGCRLSGFRRHERRRAGSCRPGCCV